MKFCQDCGFKLTRLKGPSHGWSSRYRCDHEDCGKRYQVDHIDRMGGNHEPDPITVRVDPFEDEVVA